MSAGAANNNVPTLSQVCRWATGYALRRWVPFTGVAMSLVLRVGLDLFKPWPMVFLIDHVLRGSPMPDALARFVGRLPGPSTPENLIGWSVAAVVMTFLCSWAVGLVATYGNISLGHRMTYDLAGELFAKLQQLSLDFHARKSVGDNVRRITGDCACVSIIVKDALVPMCSSVIALAGMFWILWQLDTALTMLSLAVVPCMLWVFWRYARGMMEQSYRQQESEGKIHELVEQTFSAISVVQAFGREDLNDHWFARTTRNTLAATLSLTRVQLQFKTGIGLAAALGTGAILWLGAQHALGGTLSVGGIVAFLAYLGLLYAPLESIMGAASAIQGAAGSARRVWEVLHTGTVVADKQGAAPLNEVRGHLRFEGVTFGYEPDRPVLKNISIELKPGETVALVGATGAGKSTLAGLVPRFFDPWQGRILLDGRDVRDATLKSLRGKITIVLQETFLFPVSIAENIGYGCPEATLEQVKAAARTANAHDFIERLAEGYRTIVGERGATLSGGERQRISIARALLKNAPVLILDEPTSALDAETEKGLFDALERLTRNRTTLLIAHRLSTIRRADRIVVLKDGGVFESGSHEELVARGGLYATLHAPASGSAEI
jgi:ATP-binding cassette subfamily B protein